MSRKLLIVLFVALISFTLAAQIRDSSSSSDTLVIRVFRKDGKIKWEDIHGKEQLMAVNYWYYKKEYYGFRQVNKKPTSENLQLITEYYPNGKLKLTGTTLKGKMHGTVKSYYENGNPQCICHLVNGKPDSIQIQHFDNGQIWTERLYHKGKLWEVFSNFNMQGVAMNKGTLREGNGTLLLYDESAKLIAEENYS